MFQRSTIKYEELKLGNELGRGGFGIVYQGIWRYKDVAVKKLLMENISSEAAQEFEKESKIMARLHSPNIVQFYGFCMSPTYCLVMEYMPNGSLFSVLKSDKPLEWPVRFRIAIDIAKGLAYLHHESILHRDIKSLNVLLDKDYRAKLSDFGLSKIKSETKSYSMAMKTYKEPVGTIAWTAPELFGGRKVVYTPKSDIYSLGITLWELAARKIPFNDAPNPNLIPVWVQKGDREDIPKDCPLTLATLIKKCWADNPEQRPDADTVINLLENSMEPTSQTSSRPKYLDNFSSTPTSSSQYKGNLDSELPAKAGISPKPLLFSEQFSNLNLSPKHSSIVDAKELGMFLRLVAEGEQDKAENMLKANRDLALVAGNVTDLSQRSFKNITAFQYAIWALDWHMWQMIRKYLSDEVAREQAKGFKEGSWVKTHGEHANWENLLNALINYKNYLEKFTSGYEIFSKDNNLWEQQNYLWMQVGIAQRSLPAHVINEYCNPQCDYELSLGIVLGFRSIPDFTTTTLFSRSRITSDGEWFTAKYNGGGLGETIAFGRAKWRCDKKLQMFYGGIKINYAGAVYDRGCSSVIDYDVMKNLFNTRFSQYKELISELTFSPRVSS